MMEITNKNYYSKEVDKEYMSYSQFKQFLECPAKAMAIINGKFIPESTESLLIGSYVDSWLDGELETFREEHPEIYNTRTGELKAGFKQAEELCDIIKNDEVLLKMLSGKRQVILTGSIAGVKFKGKIDSLTEDYIVDGKVLKDVADVWVDGCKEKFYMANRYDIQAVIYETLYKQNYFKELPYMLAVVTKEKQPDKRIFRFSDEIINDALQEIIAKAPVFDAIKQGKEEAWSCGKCDYCKMQKFLSSDDIEIL